MKRISAGKLTPRARVFGIAGACALLVRPAGAVAAGGSSAATEKIEVGVLLPDTESSGRAQEADPPALQSAVKKAGVNASVVNAEGDPATQQQQAQQAMVAGAKVL